MKPLRWMALSLGVASALYVATYVSFSARGSYQPVPQGFIGRVQWSPAIEPGAVEDLFRPLLQFDRRFVHRSYHHC